MFFFCIKSNQFLMFFGGWLYFGSPKIIIIIGNLEFHPVSDWIHSRELKTIDMNILSMNTLDELITFFVSGNQMYYCTVYVYILIVCETILLQRDKKPKVKRTKCPQGLLDFMYRKKRRTAVCVCVLICIQLWCWCVFPLSLTSFKVFSSIFLVSLSL